MDNNTHINQQHDIIYWNLKISRKKVIWIKPDGLHRKQDLLIFFIISCLLHYFSFNFYIENILHIWTGTDALHKCGKFLLKLSFFLNFPEFSLFQYFN